MNDLPVSVNEDNDHLGLTVSGLREEEKNIDMKIKKARGSLFKLLGLHEVRPSNSLHISGLRCKFSDWFCYILP